MKSSLVLLLLASTLVVGCAGGNPLAPDTALMSHQQSIDVSANASAVRAFLPPINPAGLSCPSDAPQIAVGSIGMRMDIEFSEVTGANKYEIEIINYYGDKTRAEVPAPAHRFEWYGVPGIYRVKVRTINCGGIGNWSAELMQTLQDGVVPEPEPPVVPPPPPPVIPPPPPPSGPICVDACPPPPPPPPQQCMTGCF